MCPGARTVNVCPSQNCATEMQTATTEPTKSFAAILKPSSNAPSLVSVAIEIVKQDVILLLLQASVLLASSCAMVSTTVATRVMNF